MSHQAVCFVDMPFGQKKDLTSGVLIDFNAIYNMAIRPAIEEVGLQAVRGDQEQTGGIIHLPMFARILLSDFMVADLTMGNPNVFYELGIRHLAKPFTTVPIFATTSTLPFDVSSVRSIPYDLREGHLEDAAANKLRSEIAHRLRVAMSQAARADSPIYDLIGKLPPLVIPDEVMKALNERIDQQDDFEMRLLAARGLPSDAARRDALHTLQTSLGALGAARRGVLMQLLFAYRDVSAFSEMVALCESLPDDLKRNAIVRQQWALGLNRRKQPGDPEKAAEMLEDLMRRRGPDPETLGILGRIYKDRYNTERQKPETARDDLVVGGHLDAAIDAYTRGFESDPRVYFPGINACTLLIHRGADEDLAKARQLIALVKFSLGRRGLATSGDYWDIATLLEVACCETDWKAATPLAQKALAAVQASFMAESTLGNLRLLQEGLARNGQRTLDLDRIVQSFAKLAMKLKGEPGG